MHIRFPIIVSFGLFVLLVVLYTTGLYFRLPWQIWWYDIILHLLGGILVGFVIVEALGLSQTKINKLIDAIFIGLISAIVIGTIWELYEVSIGATMVSYEGYPMDTVIDLLFDMLGGLAGAGYGYQQINTEHK